MICRFNFQNNSKMNSNQKEEFRYIFAGMAMIGLVIHGYPDLYNSKQTAKKAKKFANALIEELERKDDKND